MLRQAVPAGLTLAGGQGKTLELLHLGGIYAPDPDAPRETTPEHDPKVLMQIKAATLSLFLNRGQDAL
ncbi:hypothetical protein [Salipiger bermudensis]|uniref:hypothetical protein n=1 Tax=Salipiger bermudensis TaxID=344736 RepID=UPI001CD4ADA9|nr:hypothetical protein [Salipiger bermudensis]MCA0963404.1 hypothetical protein [Salipiger bermudensis]